MTRSLAARRWGWKVITLDSDLLKLVRKRTLFLGAMATLAIAVMRRCTIVGVIAVAALDARRSLNTCSHGICWYPMTPCLKVAFRRTHTRAETRPLLLRLR